MLTSWQGTKRALLSQQLLDVVEGQIQVVRFAIQGKERPVVSYGGQAGSMVLQKVCRILLLLEMANHRSLPREGIRLESITLLLGSQRGVHAVGVILFALAEW